MAPALRSCAAALGFAIAFGLPLAGAQTYPVKPIRIVVTGAGSGPDIMARLIGQRMTEAWGQQVLADARPGASGRIAAEHVARAAPDGYTLMIVTSQFAIGAALYEKLPYDPIKDFAPIVLMASTPFVLVVHPSLPARSVKDLIALARSRPGQLHHGSSGPGSPPALAAQRFKTLTGIDMLHVPFKGGSQAVVDTVAGHIHVTFAVVPAVLSTVRQGKLRGLGVTSLKRTPLVPDLPTVAETVPGYDVIGWYGLVAPARTSPDIISRLNAEVLKALQTAEFRERLAGMGADTIGSTPQEFAAYLPAQIEFNRQLIRESGAKPD
jgi:tripartite-type tricarboxylate transporter receptor subunit TctC